MFVSILACQCSTLQHAVWFMSLITIIIKCMSALDKKWFQVENGVGEAHHDQVDEQALDERDGTEEDSEDNVSEISGLSDVSITGAGRWHPMKGLLSVLYV